MSNHNARDCIEEDSSFAVRASMRACRLTPQFNF